MTFTLTIKTAETLQAEALAAHRASLIEAIDAHIENQAHQLGYKSGAQLCGYFNSTVDLWRKQARDYIAWRDNIWELAFQLSENSDPAVWVAPEGVIATLPPWPGPQV